MNVILMEVFGNDKLSKRIQSLGYGLYLYNPTNRSLVKGTSSDIGNNGIYIRDIKKARERVLNGKDIIYDGKRL